jgi:hypothetical protein
VASEFRWALAYLLPTLLHIHYGLSRVRSVGLKRDRLGGAFLSAPSTLCGFPVPAWGKQVLPCALLRSELSSPHRVVLSLSDFGLDWLTSQARYVRVPFSVGRIRARCLSVRLPNPPVRTVLAAFIAHGSREKDVYRKFPFRQLHGVHRGQLARSLTTFVPFSLPSPSGPSPCM